MQIISIPAGTGQAHISCWRCIRLELCAYGSKGTGISVGDRPLGERSERDFRPADVEDLAEGFCQAVISVPALPELLVCAWPGAGTYVPTDPLVMGVCCNLCLAYRSRTDLCDTVSCASDEETVDPKLGAPSGLARDRRKAHTLRDLRRACVRTESIQNTVRSRGLIFFMTSRSRLHTIFLRQVNPFPSVRTAGARIPQWSTSSRSRPTPPTSTSSPPSRPATSPTSPRTTSSSTTSTMPSPGRS